MKMVKSLLAAASIGMFVASAAIAADVPQGMAVKAGPVAVGDPWSGLRVGGWIGYSKFSGDAVTSGESVSGTSSSYQLKKALKALSEYGYSGARTEMDGWGVGGVIEYMVRLGGGFYVGPGAKFGWWGDEGSAVVGGQQITRKKNFDGQVYGKLEFVPAGLFGGNVGVYGLGGWTFANLKTDITGVASCGSSLSCATGSVNDRKNGWLWGIGLDALVAPKTMVFVEFSQNRYSDSSVPVSGTVDCGYKCTANYSALVTVPNKESVVKAGVVWAFGNF